VLAFFVNILTAARHHFLLVKEENLNVLVSPKYALNKSKLKSDFILGFKIILSSVREKLLGKIEFARLTNHIITQKNGTRASSMARENNQYSS
jgi:hypothetical protein